MPDMQNLIISAFLVVVTCLALGPATAEIFRKVSNIVSKERTRD